MNKFGWEWTNFAANLIRRKFQPDSRPENEQIEKTAKTKLCLLCKLVGWLVGRGNFFYFLFSLSEIMAAVLLSFTLVMSFSLNTVGDHFASDVLSLTCRSIFTLHGEHFSSSLIFPFIKDCSVLLKCFHERFFCS